MSRSTSRGVPRSQTNGVVIAAPGLLIDMVSENLSNGGVTFILNRVVARAGTKYTELTMSYQDIKGGAIATMPWMRIGGTRPREIEGLTMFRGPVNALYSESDAGVGWISVDFESVDHRFPSYTDFTSIPNGTDMTGWRVPTHGRFSNGLKSIASAAGNYETLLEIPFGRQALLDGFHLHVGQCDSAGLYLTDKNNVIIEELWTSGAVDDWCWVPCHRIISHDPQVTLTGGTSLYIKLKATVAAPAGEESVGYVQGQWDPRPADSKRFSIFKKLTKTGAGDEVTAMLTVDSGEDVIIDHASISKGEAGVATAYIAHDANVVAGATNQIVLLTQADPESSTPGYQVGRILTGPAKREIILFGTGGAAADEVMGYIDGYYINE